MKDVVMILEKEYQRRKRQTRIAIANAELDGGIISDYIKEQLDKYCYGEIEVKDIVKDIIEKYKKDLD